MRAIHVATLIAGITFLPGTTFAQDDGEGDGDREQESVIIPSQRTLDEAQLEELKKRVSGHVEKALKKCVGAYPRPEFFDTVLIQYELRKSGDLRGGYVGGAAPDPNLYVKSDEDRAKQETEGKFTRMVVREDRDLERCMTRETRGFDTGLDRYSGTLSADFAIAWEGKKPTLTANTFEVKK